MERRIQDLDYRFSKNKFKIAAYVRVVARVRGHLSWAESCIPHAQNAYRFGPLFNTRITGYGTSYTLAHVLQSCLTVYRIYVCETRRRDVFISLLDFYWSLHMTASLVQADCIKDWAHVGFGVNFCIPTNAAWEHSSTVPLPDKPGNPIARSTWNNFEFPTLRSFGETGAVWFQHILA